MSLKILCVAGARPNFIKIGPLMRALRQDTDFDARLIHTGQHYDANLSKIFFEDLEIPRPDVELEVGSGTHASQTAQIMTKFEEVVVREKPNAVLVVGDVNSTIACAMVAAKQHLPESFNTREGVRTRPIVIHVEAGLRSFDDDMPEEINRILTDRISDLLFVTEPTGMENLEREGTDPNRTHFVGNVMIDSLLVAKAKSESSQILETLGVTPKKYGLVTLHRPSNVDDVDNLRDRLSTLDTVSKDIHLVFPVHPRTRARIAENNIKLDPKRWTLADPVGYLDFVRLMANARIVLSDSGGIQEETTILKVPCVTLRENTERPVTIHEGTNLLAGTTREGILAKYKEAMEKEPLDRAPALWDGKTASRIVSVLREYFLLAAK